jgi:hypothetical protein
VGRWAARGCGQPGRLWIAQEAILAGFVAEPEDDEVDGEDVDEEDEVESDDEVEEVVDESVDLLSVEDDALAGVFGSERLSLR